MEKITLKLYDFLNLEADINGVVNPQTQQRTRKGLLQHPIPMGTKYWLTKLAKTVGDEKAIIDGLKDELIKKHGSEKEDGSISVDFTVPVLDAKGKAVTTEVTLEDGTKEQRPKYTVNPKYLEFEKEFNEVLQQEKELEYRPISLDDLKTQDQPNGIETEETYETFFKLVTE